jgi:hypothetical protein
MQNMAKLVKEQQEIMNIMIMELELQKNSTTISLPKPTLPI